MIGSCRRSTVELVVVRSRAALAVAGAAFDAVLITYPGPDSSVRPPGVMDATSLFGLGTSARGAVSGCKPVRGPAFAAVPSEDWSFPVVLDGEDADGLPLCGAPASSAGEFRSDVAAAVAVGAMSDAGCADAGAAGAGELVPGEAPAPGGAPTISS